MVSGFSIFSPMDLILYILNFALGLSSLFLIAGLIRPWWVLWFLDYQHRMRVIKIYGSAILISGALRWLVTVLLSQ